MKLLWSMVVAAALAFGALADAHAQSPLPSCPKDQNKRYHNCFGTLTWKDGAKYVGEWQNNQQDGRGTYTWPSGYKFVGEFKNGKRNGEGVLYRPDGNVEYTGEWKNSEQAGRGTFTWPDGDKYVGEWKNGKRHGWGVLYRADGSVKRSGLWENARIARPDGFVPQPVRSVSAWDPQARTSPLLSVLEGHSELVISVAFAPDGRTALSGSEDKTMKLWDATTGGLLRTFEADADHVYSVAFAPDGRTALSGSEDKTLMLWDLGIAGPAAAPTPAVASAVPAQSILPPCPRDQKQRYDNCFGTRLLSGGDTNVGEFKDDKYHGAGTYSYPTGAKYVGEYRNGKRNGQGTQTVPNADTYAGEWSDGKRNGQGTVTFPDGTTYAGQWKDDKANGQGTFTSSDGTKYVGGMKDNNYHGKGVRYRADGSVEQSGLWENGTLVQSMDFSSPPAPAVAPPPAVAAVAAVPPRPEPTSETRIALVIGNSAYEAVPRLENPRRDAKVVADTLRAVGFTRVVEADDLSREQLIAAVRAFAAEADRADWAMVYFAGHGMEIAGVNYLIPVDAKLLSDRVTRSSRPCR